MLRGNPPPPPPTSLFFLFLSIAFPSIFKKKSENFGGGGLNPLNPPLKYALERDPKFPHSILDMDMQMNIRGLIDISL